MLENKLFLTPYRLYTVFMLTVVAQQTEGDGLRLAVTQQLSDEIHRSLQQNMLAKNRD